MENHSITQGGIRQLWRISMPLMISNLAMLFMIFVDRVFLSNYSLESLNAAVNAGTLAWAFFGGYGTLTSMSQVFVAQFIGAKKPQETGAFVWQMIWISFFSIFIFIPLGLWGSSWIYSFSPYAPLQIEYFRYLMIFGPGYALMTAVSGFYIGRGKTKILIWLAIIANLINIILDRAFIFGVGDWIPEMGIKGAAIATCTGYLLQAVILFFLFLLPKNRKLFGTNNWQLRKPKFLKSLSIGAPQGIFYSLELFGWVIFYEMMTALSITHITISAICQSILILLSFFMEGLGKGVAALAGNFIGAKKFDLTKKVLKSGIYLQLLFSFVVVAFFVSNPSSTIPYLIPDHTSNESLLLNYEFIRTLQISFIFVFFYLTFEGIRWVLAGLLAAAGDTLFLLIAGSISVWIFLLIPIYFLVVLPKSPVELAWAWAFIYSLIACFIYWIRFYQGKWKEIDLIQDSIAKDPKTENPEIENQNAEELKE